MDSRDSLSKEDTTKSPPRQQEMDVFTKLMLSSLFNQNLGECCRVIPRRKQLEKFRIYNDAVNGDHNIWEKISNTDSNDNCKESKDDNLDLESCTHRKDEAYKFHDEVNNEVFHRMPPKVQQAIREAQQKKLYSNFYQKLNNANEKIKIFQQVFCERKPKFEESYKRR